MIGWIARLLEGGDPALGEARPADAAALSSLHAASFHRGWSEDEMERLLLDPHVLAHRAAFGAKIAGFILSRLVADEAEILSVAVAHHRRGRGLARELLDLHLRRLAGLGARTVFLEVDQDNSSARRLYARAGFHEVGRRDGYYQNAGGEASAALVLRRDL
ncbi:MAG TPA: ribosomal protein S18-alanine N-acetyltransferase [Xanthobacteraceae bacterium]|nr:ribosomal protein S18-alanine N-acetyltransferase [Xanthobacteraceae bacterium]